jgi:hypothetical protein
MIELIIFNEPQTQQVRDFYQRVEDEICQNLDTLDALREEKEKEYKDKTGWTERFQRSQSEISSEDSFIVDPYDVLMSEDDFERFRAQYFDIGKDITLKCPIGLHVIETTDDKVKYFFGVKVSDWGNHDSKHYGSISELVYEIKLILSNISSHFFEANVIPTFYTYSGRTTNDAFRQAMRRQFESLSEKEMKAVFGEHVKKPTKEEIDKMEFSEFRGLSETEIKELADLYQRNSKPKF